MKIPRIKLFSKPSMKLWKKSLKINKSVTGLANKKISKESRKIAGKIFEASGKETNIITGRNGSFYKVNFYKNKRRAGNHNFQSKNSEVEQLEISGFRRGEVRKPIETDPKIKGGLYRKPRTSSTRGTHGFPEMPGENIRTKIDFVNGSGRLNILPPKLPI